ncbi:hypothetical protein DCO58_08720 [Helicobacter saguini]|uniref:Uncharacterized protein n=1 Tax=Helicobacter saguini TaxID=1548018 RepID=A0A6B0HT66_9HELI|nr:hypothetical protein [Helicobacter saguini]MWV61596.1 hypothetical protein [Helicobacter saguini]MWV67732.1 hypothetical protein [Helicobacter saguini]MWV70799.1 hypothetical protein [Helicobacter saguini]MWV72703.1 hypothetical protein [Helicobacter saguini]
MAEKNLFSKEWESLIYNECEKRGYFGVNGNLKLQDSKNIESKNVDSKNSKKRAKI